jgi:hypothetical protein
VVLSRTLLAGEKTTIGGFDENKLKKLKGLRFTCPFLSIVETKAMGLGATACCSHCCFWAGESVFKSSVIKYFFGAEKEEKKNNAELKIIYDTF